MQQDGTRQAESGGPAKPTLTISQSPRGGGTRQAESGGPTKPTLTISQSPRGGRDEGGSNLTPSLPNPKTGLTADPTFQGKCAAEMAAERIGLTVTRHRAPGSLSSWEQHQVLVTGLEPNGVAQKSELVRIGDEIVTVDGQAVYSLSLSEVVRQIEKTALEAGSSLLTLGIHRNNVYMLANLYRPLKPLQLESATQSDELRRSSSDVDFDYRSPNGRPNTPRQQTPRQHIENSQNREKGSAVASRELTTKTSVRRRPLFDLAKDEKLRRIFVSKVEAEFNDRLSEAILVGDTLLAIDGAYLRWDDVDKAKRLIFGNLEQPGEDKATSLSFLRKGQDKNGNSCPRAFSISVSPKSCVKETLYKESLYKAPLQDASPPSPRPEHQGKDFWLSQLQEAEQAQKLAESRQTSAPAPVTNDTNVIFPRASSASDEWMEEDEWLKMIEENQRNPPFLTKPASIHVSVQSVKDLPKGLEKSHNLSCQLSLGGRTEQTTPTDDIRFSHCNVNCIFHSSNPSSDMLAIKIVDLSSPPDSPPVGSVNLLVDNLARWARSQGTPSRCWFRLRAESGKPVPGSDGLATLELCWEILKAENPLSARDYALRDRSRSPPRMKAGPARSPGLPTLDTQSDRGQSVLLPVREAYRTEPMSPQAQLAVRMGSAGSRLEENRTERENSNGDAWKERARAAVDEVELSLGGSERNSAPNLGLGGLGPVPLERRSSAEDQDSFMIGLQKQLALTEERIMALEHEKQTDAATIQMHSSELQARTEVLNSLSAQLKTVEGDGKGTIAGHARSGVVLRELEDLLAAASTDVGAGEGFRMPSSAFLAQGCAEAMVMANIHRYIHARKQRTLKAEEALAGAERVISDQAAEIIGLKAQIRETTGKTPRRRKSLEGGAQTEERGRDTAKEVRPTKVDVSTATEEMRPPAGTAVATAQRHTPRALLQEQAWEPPPLVSMGPGEKEQRTRQELEQDVKAACAQVEEQMVLIARLHARMDQAGIALPEDLVSARSIILPPSRKGTGVSQRLATPRQIDTDAPQAPRSGSPRRGPPSQPRSAPNFMGHGLNAEAPSQAVRGSEGNTRRRNSHTRLF